MNLYHVTKFSLFLMFIVHYFYKKVNCFTPVLSIRIALSCFYLLSCFEIFSTRIWRLPFAVNVTLKLSIFKLLTRIEFLFPGKKMKNWSSTPFRMEWKRCTHSACCLGILLEIQDLSRRCLPQNHILWNQIVTLHVDLCSLNQST